MEEIMLFVNEHLPIIIAYLIVFAEIIGQLFLKLLFKKGKLFLLNKVNNASDNLGKAQKELMQQKAEWDKDKAELHNTINMQAEKIEKIEKILKAYAKKYQR